MERLTRFRGGLLLVILAVIMSLFALRLYALQNPQDGSNKSNIKTFTLETTVKAARGEILDCNGNVLVSNRASYDLMFNHYVIRSAADTNGHLLRLVQLCRELDIAYIEHFPVTKAPPFTYTLSDYNATWQGYFQAYLPEVGNLDSDISAPLLIVKLREFYDIPDNWTDEDARAVLGLRYELALRSEITNLSNYVFLEDASTETLAALLELNVPGLKAEATTVREYNTQYAAHILGYVGPITAKQWEETYREKKGYSMDALVGQSGLELAFEDYLHGTDGVRVDVVTVDGTVIDSYYKKNKDGKELRPVSGKNVEISIDLNLQSTAESALETLITGLQASGEGLEDGEKKPDGSDIAGGAVVVMNVKTGQVMACASYPTYNLSTYHEDYNELLEADNDPLFNRALQAIYPPGSTFKMVMVVAGIDSGKIDRYTIIKDEGEYRKYAASGYTPACMIWNSSHATHGEINAMEALRDSCNYYFYALADEKGVSIHTIDHTAKGLGLGEPTGIELFEYTGYRSNPETKKALFKGDNARWYPSDLIGTSIGQSENRFTPMQLCSYTATLANRGTRYKATFMNRVLSSDYKNVEYQSEPEILSTFQISDEAYAAYTEGMRLVATNGSTYLTFGDYPVKIAAKTGTAQTDPGVSDNGAFVCYAPFDDPEIAVVVYGEKAGWGSTMGQIAKAITDTYFHDEINGNAATGENTVS